MTAADQLPNAQKLKELLRQRFPGQKQSVIAKRLGIAIGTLRTILKGEGMISGGKLESLADKLDVPIATIIIPVETRWLPMDPVYYERLSFGYFLDHDRHRSGAVKWWRESLSLHADNTPQESATPINFHGTVTNQWDNTFNLEAVLTNKFHFSMHAVHSMKSSNVVICFDAVLSQRVDDVLCGLWSGINHFESRPAVFRMFLSPKEIPKHRLVDLSASVRVGVHLESDDVGYGD